MGASVIFVLLLIVVSMGRASARGGRVNAKMVMVETIATSVFGTLVAEVNLAQVCARPPTCHVRMGIGECMTKRARGRQYKWRARTQINLVRVELVKAL